MLSSRVASGRKYLRQEVNLEDEARLARLERLGQRLGEPTKSGTLRRAIDELARQHGVYHAPDEVAQLRQEVELLRALVALRPAPETKPT